MNLEKKRPAINGSENVREDPLPSTQDLFTADLLYRYATCDDLLTLKMRYPQYCFNGSNAWGLKQMGTLFCIEKIEQLAPARMLEVGAGCNPFFDRVYGASREYWMIDDDGFYPKERFEAGMRNRRHTQWVKSLLGSYSSDLPENYFDLVFSISVLEHVPAEDRSHVYKDMFRIVRPGGFIVHSIDSQNETRGREEYVNIRSVGFLSAASPDLTMRIRAGEGASTLFEPLDIVFTAYGKRHADRRANLRAIRGHMPTVLVVARKP